MLLGTPRGAFTAILRINVHSPLGIFQGILSEYLALKCSPIVVYMDFGYFLVIPYIYHLHTHLPPAHALVQSRFFSGGKQNQINKSCDPLKCSRGFPSGYRLFMGDVLRIFVTINYFVNH